MVDTIKPSPKASEGGDQTLTLIQTAAEKKTCLLCSFYLLSELEYVHNFLVVLYLSK